MITLAILVGIIAPLDMSSMKFTSRIASSANSTFLTVTGLLSALIDVLSLSIFVILLVYNRRLKLYSFAATMSEKYQIDENIRAIELMLPLVITNFVCYFPSSIGVPVYLWLHPNPDQASLQLITDICDFVIYYPTLLSIVLFIQFFYRRYRERQIFDDNMIARAKGG